MATEEKSIPNLMGSIGNLSEVHVRKFVRESNLIEGIDREPTFKEIEGTKQFLELEMPTAHHLWQLVQVYAPGADLRAHDGMNVSVGNHVPPRGGIAVAFALDVIIGRIMEGSFTPYEAHCEYEKLHPFMDGNGRSGRALWAWHMLRTGRYPFGLSFLQRWYYDSLDSYRK